MRFFHFEHVDILFADHVTFGEQFLTAGTKYRAPKNPTDRLPRLNVPSLHVIVHF